MVLARTSELQSGVIALHDKVKACSKVLTKGYGMPRKTVHMRIHRCTSYSPVKQPASQRGSPILAPISARV